jgi:transaldolase
MIVAIAADHAGLPLRQALTDVVSAEGHEPLLLGPSDGRPVDYPLVTRLVADAIATGEAERGILICGSGAGVTVAANKLPLIRAAYGTDHYTAGQMVEHDSCNVIAMGARVMGPAVAAEVVQAFLGARFSGEERHARRLAAVLEFERLRSLNAATRLHEVGQSLWLDYITRELLNSGDLARYIASAAVTGLTSNPTIFDKAITGSGDYDEQVRQLSERGMSTEELFFELALDDLRRAAGLFRPTWDASQGRDGYVSLEVSPKLAYDTEATIAQAKMLHEKAATPNLLVKVPGTQEGLAAIEELIFAGVPLNVTLLFSDDHYMATAAAYGRGLQRRHEAGLHLKVASVASVFISRWDQALINLVPEELQDQLGIAIAKRCYRAYRRSLGSSDWKMLEAAGARPQRLLFASTGTKSKARPDTYYVEALAAPDTINTMPQPTLDAFIDHGHVGELLSADAVDADQMLAQFESNGIDVTGLGARLQREGADAFVDSWEDLMQKLAGKATKVSAGVT